MRRELTARQRVTVPLSDPQAQSGIMLERLCAHLQRAFHYMEELIDIRTPARKQVTDCTCIRQSADKSSWMPMRCQCREERVTHEALVPTLH
jgi:hypothetical protein